MHLVLNRPNTKTSKTPETADHTQPQRTPHDDHAATPADATRASEPARIGDQLVGVSGLIWTVTAIVGHGSRVVLSRPTPDGPAAIIVDHVAVNRMVPVPVRHLTQSFR